MSDDATLIATLKYTTMQINRHGALLIILFGTTGNLLNFFVLNDRSFQKNLYTIYLWWSSIASIVFIWSELLTRIFEGYGISWPNQNQPLCKIRLFILMIYWSMATWAFIGATIDRYLCSNPSIVYRLKSNSRTARHYLSAILIISVIIFAQIFYCYEASVPNVPVPCYTQTLVCQLYNDWMNILFDIVIPSVFMAVFGGLTVINIRTRVIYPMPNTEPYRRNIDRNLRKLLLIQISHFDSSNAKLTNWDSTFLC